MSDVFISYASEDRPRAHDLAQALEARGWSVWWDRKILTGQAFDKAIETALDAAGCVVVLWSPRSVESEWVKNEAASGAERGVLVPALIAPVKLPLEFRRKQTADLHDWRGEPGHGGFQALCDGIAATLGQENPPAPPRTTAPPAVAPPGKGRMALLAGGAVLITGIGAFLGVRHYGPEAVPAEPSPGAASPRTIPQETRNLAALIAGRYDGEVVADSKGSSRKGVSITLTPLAPDTVRITSDYSRIPTVDVPIARSLNSVLHAGGDTVLRVDLDKNPPTIDYTPHGELAFSGTRR